MNNPSIQSIQEAVLVTIKHPRIKSGWQRTGSGAVSKGQKNQVYGSAVKNGAVRCVTCQGAVMPHGQAIQQGKLNHSAVIGHILVPSKLMGCKGGETTAVAALYGLHSPVKSYTAATSANPSIQCHFCNSLQGQMPAKISMAPWVGASTPCGGVVLPWDQIQTELARRWALMQDWQALSTSDCPKQQGMAANKAAKTALKSVGYGKIW